MTDELRAGQALAAALAGMTCPNCGALVGDMAAHQQFHLALDHLERTLGRQAQVR